MFSIKLLIRTTNITPKILDHFSLPTIYENAHFSGPSLHLAEFSSVLASEQCYFLKLLFFHQKSLISMKYLFFFFFWLFFHRYVHLFSLIAK